MIRCKLLFLSLILSYSSFGQTKKYSEKDILKAQRITAARVIVALESNNANSILQYFGDDIENLESKLNESILEIDAFQESTTFSDVIVFDEGSHIFRCRYSDKKRARFQIDIYFQSDNPNSKVIKFIIAKDEILKEEYERRINNSDIPPPPPPPSSKKKKKTIRN